VSEGPGFISGAGGVPTTVYPESAQFTSVAAGPARRGRRGAARGRHRRRPPCDRDVRPARHRPRRHGGGLGLHRRRVARHVGSGRQRVAGCRLRLAPRAPRRVTPPTRSRQRTSSAHSVRTGSGAGARSTLRGALTQQESALRDPVTGRAGRFAFLPSRTFLAAGAAREPPSAPADHGGGRHAVAAFEVARDRAGVVGAAGVAGQLERARVAHAEMYYACP